MKLRYSGGRAIPGLLFFIALLSLGACARLAERSDGQTVRQPDSPTVIDSILPVEEEVRRFRANVPDVPAHLTGGASSRDALVRRWVKAVESRDSTALRDMLMSAAEYITFFYPESPYTKPPYRQSPSVRWGLITNASVKGSSRVWERHAGQPMGFTGYRCDQEPTEMGKNRIWTNCAVELKTGPIALFGPIIERDGQFKFVTYGSGY